VKKQRQSKEQKLRETVMAILVALREIEPKVGIAGINQRYLDTFEKYSEALHELVEHTCGMHIVDWDWDGYEARFTFRWDFSAQVRKLNRPAFDTHFVALSTRAQFDDAKPLDEELARLRVEVEHFDDLRTTMMQRAYILAEATQKETK